jgi:excisionase family DNA binding protein
MCPEMSATSSPLLISSDVAEMLRCSLRSVHELTRQRSIPHRKLPGTTRCLFVREELEAWLDGAALEIHELGSGGRVGRPTEVVRSASFLAPRRRYPWD